MFERPTRGERAIILSVRVGKPPYREDAAEFQALAESSGADLIGTVEARLRKINPRHLIGSGKLEELGEASAAAQADLILVDHELTPGQERNLERALQCRVVDRTGLILDIFALRAHTFEGKLQVELAQLEHLSTRLVRGWSHLERQKGGIGLRGPGETQLETDRRLLGARIKQLQSRLERLAKRRGLARRHRQKQDVPTISLVGYTNAGKSTLFNRLTDAGVLVADQLFATLDPTIRRLELPDRGPVVLADTVGFVRELPHELVAAFQSTLEETLQARLLLHVIDCSDPEHLERIDDVNRVLALIGADRIPVIQVYNKADILSIPPRIDRAETGKPQRVWLSAATGNGVDVLLSAISEFLHLDVIRGQVRLGVAQSRLRAVLYEKAKIIREQELNDGGWVLDLEINRRSYEDLRRHEALELLEPSGSLRSVMTANTALNET